MRKSHIALIVSIIALSFSLFGNLVAVNNNAAVCKFRADLQARYAAGQKYLNEHPNGAPALGLSYADLKRSVDSQAATLKSLDNLRCVTS